MIYYIDNHSDRQVYQNLPAISAKKENQNPAGLNTACPAPANSPRYRIRSGYPPRGLEPNVGDISGLADSASLC